MSKQVNVYASFFTQTDIPALLTEIKTGKIIKVSRGFEKLFNTSEEALIHIDWRKLTGKLPSENPSEKKSSTEHLLMQSIFICHNDYKYELIPTPGQDYQFIIFRKKNDESKFQIAECL
jgi:hypothetical protein